MILVSARGSDVDKVAGLHLGADDYVTKPFSPSELMARVESVLRRSSRVQATVPSAGMTIGHLAVDTESRVASVAGRVVALTPKEFDLLAVLCRFAGVALDREKLLDLIWGSNFYSMRTVDIHILRLRKKLAGAAWSSRPCGAAAIACGRPTVLEPVLRLVSGLQVRLFLAMSLVLFVAILVTGSVFVYRDRLERRAANLEAVANATMSFSVAAAPFEYTKAAAGVPFTPTATMDMLPGDLLPGAEGMVAGITGGGVHVCGGSGVATGGTVISGNDLESLDGKIHASDGVTVFSRINSDKLSYVSPDLKAVPYRIMLVNTDGEIVSDPTGSLVGSKISIPEVDAADQARGYVTWKFDAPGTGAVSVSKDVTFLAGAKELSTPNQNGLLSIAAIDTRSLTADWLATLPQLAISGIFGIPISLLAAALVTRRITTPLHQLTRAAEAMSRGDFDQRVEIAGRDEVAVLASSFTVMAGRVKERDSQLRDLLANVSHDLRTPLTSIQGYAEALTDGVAEREEVDQAARIIRESAQHANSVLADLLVLSEIDVGEVIVRRERVELGPLLDRCLRRLEQRAGDRGIELRRTPIAGPIVMGDPDKLERVISNVLDNAVKYATGWVEVTWLPGTTRC